MSLADARPFFHCDLVGDAVFQKSLHVPKTIRTLIVSQDIPFPRNLNAVALDISAFRDLRGLYNYRSDWLAWLKETTKV